MDSKYPVFVFPTSLKFSLLSRQTHKALITIYNPSDNPVRFKVMCTSPNKFSVVDPEGVISPQGCIDVAVRHMMPTANNCNSSDKFRVQILDHTTKQVLGKRDIEARLFPGEEKQPSIDGDNFHTLPHEELGMDDSRQTLRFSNRNLQNKSLPNISTNYLIVVLGIVCISALLLPTHNEVSPPPSSIPQYLHLPVHLKLVFAYALGLVTMVIFRP